MAGAGDGAKVGGAAWEREFDRWLAPCWAALRDERRRRWAPTYARGLLGPSARKSVQPLAARVAPGDYAQLHHFVCTSGWDPGPLERVLAEQAQALVGGPDAVLIVDDTALLKQGTHSVGVIRQYPVRRRRRQEDQLPGARLAHARSRRGARLRRPAPLPARGVDA